MSAAEPRFLACLGPHMLLRISTLTPRGDCLLKEHFCSLYEAEHLFRSYLLPTLKQVNLAKYFHKSPKPLRRSRLQLFRMAWLTTKVSYRIWTH